MGEEGLILIKVQKSIDGSGNGNCTDDQIFTLFIDPNGGAPLQIFSHNYPLYLSLCYFFQ